MEKSRIATLDKYLIACFITALVMEGVKYKININVGQKLRGPRKIGRIERTEETDKTGRVYEDVNKFDLNDIKFYDLNSLNYPYEPDEFYNKSHNERK